MYPKLRQWCCCTFLALVPITGVFAASAKTYQVTGPVTAVTPTVITVAKDGEAWEIARDPSAKSDAEVKVGDRVTVHYRMHATKIEAKPGKSDGQDSDAASAKRKPKSD